MGWAWAGNELSIAGKLYALQPAKPVELVEFENSLAVSRDIVAGLREARLSFRTGSARYYNACENYAHLLAELRGAEINYHLACQNLSAFFNPAIPAEDLPREPELSILLDETLCRIKAQ